MESKNKIEVCFSPIMYPYFANADAITVVIDILRASSAICTAFMNGADKIIPVGTLEEAFEMKEKGYMVAAERDGIVRDFADFGNSPYNFTPERVLHHDIVYSTTNGTQAIQLASESYQVLVGSFLNISALVEHLVKMDRDVLLFCAGWKNKFSLEDTLFAGALTEVLLKKENFYTICDSALASVDLWSLAKKDVIAYVDKVAQRERLRINKLDDVIGFCHTPDQTDIIPVLENEYLIKLNSSVK